MVIPFHNIWCQYFSRGKTEYGGTKKVFFVYQLKILICLRRLIGLHVNLETLKHVVRHD